MENYLILNHMHAVKKGTASYLILHRAVAKTDSTKIRVVSFGAVRHN